MKGVDFVDFREKIILNAIEDRVYWWINIFKLRTRELLLYPSKDKNEIKFVNIEWRNIYLALTNNLNIENLEMSKKNFEKITLKQEHNTINRELSKILNIKVPDINLITNSLKDWYIYDSREYLKKIYNGTHQIEYPNEYILTGDFESLKFYNHLLAIIYVLDIKYPNIKSIKLLKEKFCVDYILENNLNTFQLEVFKKFTYNLYKACTKELIILGQDGDSYTCNFKEFDLKEFENYLNWAENYLTTKSLILVKTYK